MTLRPSLNQQLSQWEMLFPFEQQPHIGFMNAVGGVSPTALEALTGPLWTWKRRWV